MKSMYNFYFNPRASLLNVVVCLLNFYGYLLIFIGDQLR